MHTIKTRPPTPEEARVLRARSGPDFASFGCLLLFFGIGPIFLLGKLGAWLAGMHSPDSVTAGRWMGWVAGLIVCVWAIRMFIPYERRRRQKAHKDAEDLQVEEISVSAARVIELALVNDNEPILVFEIGEGKLLYLQGQWLREPDTYGAPRPEEDPDERYLNGLPAPFSFPSSEFTVTRFPHSGNVSRIAVRGEYRAPERKVDALKREYDFASGEIFEGSLDDIAGVLARAHAAKASSAKPRA